MLWGADDRIWLILVLLLLAFVRGCLADCPSSCTCGLGNGTVVCHGAQLTTPPRLLPDGIRRLDLSSNLIEWLGRETFGNLTELQELDLNNNLVSNIEDEAFNGLPSLLTLRLSGNRLSTIQSSVMRALPNLRRLELGDRLVHVEAGAFTGLARLRHLSLGMASAACQVPIVSLSSLHGLRSLHLSGLGARTLEAGSFHGLRRLRHLCIERWPQLAELNPGVLDSLNLTSLSITHCNLSSVPSHSFTHLVHLRRLDLSHNPITAVQGNALEGLAGLRELRLAGGGHLAEIRAGAFRGLPSLRALDVSGNRLVTLEEAAFESVGSLESLGLGSNPLACDCRLSWLLQARAPGLDWGRRLPTCTDPEGARSLQLVELGPAELTCHQPRINIRPQAQVSVAEGQTVRLACGAVGRPAPVVNWVAPDLRLLSGGKGGRLRMLADGSLEIHLAQAGDSGLYLCTAFNLAGNDSASAHLLVSGWGTPTTPASAFPSLLDPPTLTVVLTLGLACFLGVTVFCFALLLLWGRLKGPIKRTSSVEVLRHSSGTSAQSEAVKYTTKML
ncbi:leucine-rich repeat and immunoglobulin-like domain-containing nogo receptor-interacting protein 1 [Hypanus sabinus]|uniref:leucine-rich repeat and immunoglobulin-like domain-containing nogo receptor-interacting protein 1 n=1 Tax=Hypanus sabinus TaxID=79690 RepID=UPI0028C4BA84|nr:leucine-rich repeat and immunoglobulin-like domain-containing nogo receptor-interacting protein 1 [Hypanus sabinus]